MGTQTDALNTRQGALWVQPGGPNTPVYFLGCHDLGDISEPSGSLELLRCMDKKGGWKTVGSLQAPPDPVTTSIENMTFLARDWLEKLNCDFTLFAFHRAGGEPDIFYNYARGLILNRCRVTTLTHKQIVHHEEEQASSQSRDIEAWPPLYETGALTARRQSTSETLALNDVVSYSALDCDEGVVPGDQVVASADGSTYAANVLQTLNAGTLWSALGTDPFAVNKNILSIVSFPISDTITRFLVAQIAVAGQQGKVAYTDDNGATWTVVNIGGAAAGRGAVDSGALFALDQGHVWLASAGGYIYFSDDGGASWSEQTAGDVVTEDLRGISFSTENNGMAVGDNDVILYSSDGGTTWEQVTSLGNGDNLACVFPSGKFWWVGSSSGTLWYSRNNGETWTQRRFSGDSTGDVADIVFANDLIGYMIHNTGASVGRVFVTVNGGFSWNIVTVPANNGLNALAVADENTVYAVGEAEGGTAVIIKLTWD
jgi:photosystem II stability/assembly factor-like uncharacterized protein